MRGTQRFVARPDPASAAAAAVLCLLLSGCAKISDPQPPVANVLKPATDLQARQFGQKVVLVVTLSTEYTSGSSAPKPESAEILKVVEPDRKAGTALSEEVFLERASVLATLPADAVATRARDGKLVFEDDLSAADPGTVYAGAFRYAVRFLNRRNETAGLSNQMIIAPLPLPPPPDRLRFDLNQDRIRLTWDAPAGNVDGSQPPNIEGYNIYRAEAPDAFGGAPLNPKPVPPPEFEDRAFEFDKTYYYKVSIVGRSAAPYAETAASPALQVVARDTFPPGPPSNLDAVFEGGVVFLLWSAPPQSDVAGYRIYRTAAGGAREQLEKELMKETSYRDTKAPGGQSYTYAVHAVDTHGNEGPPAEASIGIP